MFTGKSLTRCLALAAATFLLTVATAFAGDAPPAAKQPAAPAPKKHDTKAVLTGNADAYAAFHDKLVAYLKQPSIEEGGVGCMGCKTVQNEPGTTKPLRVYTFAASPEMFSKVLAAWNDVKSKDVSLTFGDYKPGEPDCGPPKPQPCISNFNCPDLLWCSATRPLCRACGT